MTSFPYLLCLATFTLAGFQSPIAQAEKGEVMPTSPAEALVREGEAPADQEAWWGRIGVGGKLGPGLATFTGDDAHRQFTQSTNKPAFTFGGFANIGLNRWASLQLEALYAFKGTKVETDGSLNDTWNIRYIEAPLLARITIPTSTSVTPYLLAGPVAGYLLSLEIVDADDGAISDRKDEARAIDMGLLFGLGSKIDISLQHALVVEARYNRSLTSIDKTDRVDLRNQVLQLLIGYQYSFSSAASSSPQPASPMPDESESLDTDRDDVDNYEMMD